MLCRRLLAANIGVVTFFVFVSKLSRILNQLILQNLEMKLHFIVLPFIVSANHLHLRSQKGCECDDFINPSGWGNCIKEEDGKPMCYVKNPSTSTCSDLVTSASDVTRKWSFEACRVPPTTTGCKTDDDCTGEETCINGKCACGNQQSCMGDVSAPICDSANSLCKCSVLAKGRFSSCANQEKSPICDVAGHKCTCGTKGPCKGEEVCHKDDQGTGFCKEKLCGAVACGPGETCDEFAKICRCGTGPSCVGFERAPECKSAMIVAPEDCANAKNKKECCANANNKKGCEDAGIAKVLSQTVTMKCKCGDQQPCDKGLKCVKEKCVKI